MIDISVPQKMLFVIMFHSHVRTKMSEKIASRLFILINISLIMSDYTLNNIVRGLSFILYKYVECSTEGNPC